MDVREYQSFKDELIDMVFNNPSDELIDALIEDYGADEFNKEFREEFVRALRINGTIDDASDVNFDLNHISYKDIPRCIELHNKGLFDPHAVAQIQQSIEEAHHPETASEYVSYVTVDDIVFYGAEYIDIEISGLFHVIEDADEIMQSLSENYQIDEHLKEVIDYASELLKNQDLLYQWSLSSLSSYEKYDIVRNTLSKNPRYGMTGDVEDFMDSVGDIDLLYKGRLRAFLVVADFTDIEVFRDGTISVDSEPYDILDVLYEHDKFFLDLYLSEDVFEQWREYTQALEDEYEDEY